MITEHLAAKAQIPLEAYEAAPPERQEALKRQLAWPISDAVVTHLLANQGKAIAYRLTVQDEEDDRHPGAWRDVKSYRLYMEVLGYSYRSMVVANWANDWDTGIVSQEYEPLWHQLPKSALPPETRIVKETVVRWRHTTRGMGAKALLRALWGRYKRFLRHAKRGVNPPDRSRYEAAILDWEAHSPWRRS